MQGQFFRNAVLNLIAWITPAYAGNSCICFRAYLLVWDYPPHTRGIVLYKRPGLRLNGITPAYAGNSQVQL